MNIHTKNLTGYELCWQQRGPNDLTGLMPECVRLFYNFKKEYLLCLVLINLYLCNTFFNDGGDTKSIFV
jgi:hypothetical protein